MEPLREQSGKAKKFLVLRDELRGLERMLLFSTAMADSSSLARACRPCISKRSRSASRSFSRMASECLAEIEGQLEEGRSALSAKGREAEEAARSAGTLARELEAPSPASPPWYSPRGPAPSR